MRTHSSKAAVKSKAQKRAVSSVPRLTIVPASRKAHRTPDRPTKPQVKRNDASPAPERPASSALLLDPKSVIPSRWMNRHKDSFNCVEFLALKSELQRDGGNRIPIKVRPIQQPNKETLKINGASWEIVYGHRRHKACLELGLPVLAFTETIDDQCLVIDMHTENQYRKDLSAYERGLSYARMRDQGLFASQRKLSEALGVDVADISRMIFLSKLDAELLATMRSPLELAIHDADKLRQAWEMNPQLVLSRARKLNESEGPLPAKIAIRRLTETDNSSVGGSNTVTTRPLVIKGQKCGQIVIDAFQRVSIQLNDPLSPARIDALEAQMRLFLQKEPAN